MVVCSCNPSYSRGRDQEDLNSRPAQVKVTLNKQTGMVVQSFKSSWERGTGRIMAWGQPKQKVWDPI
jgi:hypothetical protein